MPCYRRTWPQYVALVALTGPAVPLALAALVAAGPAMAATAQPAAVRLQGAAVRSTQEGQSTSIGFLSLTARRHARLLRATTPLADAVALHTMQRNNDGQGLTTVRMAATGPIDLPAGRRVVLRAGADHLMFGGLRRPLTQGDRLPLTVYFEDTATRRQFHETVQARVTDQGVPGDFD